MGSMADPFHGFSRLLHVPSAVLYLLEAGGHLGVPLRGHPSSSCFGWNEPGNPAACRLTFSGNLEILDDVRGAE